MAIQHIHSFLVYPAKNEEEQPEISGAEIPRHGKLYNMLSEVFDRSPQECNIEIAFRADDAGRQQNDCRDLILAYANDPNIANGRSLASRLQAVTTHRSGLGLFFLTKGEEEDNHLVLASRFPADQGVIAEPAARRLSVSFVERVFLKNAKAYKSALYTSDSLERGFWEGRAIDLQISGPRELSDYWIFDFLASELRTTGPAGTKRFAVALREAIARSPNADVRHQLISAASLVGGQDGRRQSVNQLVDRLGLSDPAKTVLKSQFAREELLDETFQFDNEEFRRFVLYRGVELDNGALLMAEDSRFNQVFERQEIVQGEGRVRFSTEGQVTNEYLRKTK
jgi:hypothetical protein